MTTVQLRRYETLPGQTEDFRRWWETLVPVRESYGFRVLFAFVDERTNEFVRALSHEGDLDDAELVHYGPSERARIAAGVPCYYERVHISKVEAVRGLEAAPTQLPRGSA